MKRLLALLVLTVLAAPLSAQMFFQENFELSPPDGQTTLGSLNGWQAAWNDPAESQAALADLNMNWEAPFWKRGLAIQISSSRNTAFRELPEALNGKTVYFSYLFRFFQEEGGTGQFRVRSDAGHVAAVGFSDNQLYARIQSEETRWGSVRHRENYFLAGVLRISEDGQTVQLAANAYTTRASIPVEVPQSWDGRVEHRGPTRRWNGVEFMAASQNVAFDDLRIGFTWTDVAGTRR